MLVRNLVITIITAPELLVSLIVIAIYIYYPQPLEFVGGKLTSEAESWKYITAIPCGFFIWCVKLFSDIRSPSDKSENKILYDWPHYRWLVSRLYLALVLSGLSAAVSIGLWLLGKDLDHPMIGALFIGAVGVSLVVSATLTFARSRLKELLTQHGS